MTEKRFLYELHKGCFRDNGVEMSIIDVLNTLNEQHEQIRELHMRYDAQRELYCQLDCVKNNLYRENEELKQQVNFYKYFQKDARELEKENEELKIRFREERELAMRLSRECDTLTIKKQELELEIIRLEEIIKTGKR